MQMTPAITLGIMAFQSTSRGTRAPSWRRYRRRASCMKLQVMYACMHVASLRKDPGTSGGEERAVLKSCRGLSLRAAAQSRYQ